MFRMDSDGSDEAHHSDPAQDLKQGDIRLMISKESFLYIYIYT